MMTPEFIYVLPGRYARGRAGERARKMVYSVEPLRGVTGRRPVIPIDAPKMTRRIAGRALCKALGLEYWP